MDRETLEAEAARLGYKLVKADRIKVLEFNIRRHACIPDSPEYEKYINDYIRNLVVEELYKKMEEFNKIGKYIHRYNEELICFDIDFKLEVIVPDAPTRRGRTGESHLIPIQR